MCSFLFANWCHLPGVMEKGPPTQHPGRNEFCGRPVASLVLGALGGPVAPLSSYLQGARCPTPPCVAFWDGALEASARGPEGAHSRPANSAPALMMAAGLREERGPTIASAPSVVASKCKPHGDGLGAPPRPKPVSRDLAMVGRLRLGCAPSLLCCLVRPCVALLGPPRPHMPWRPLGARVVAFGLVRFAFLGVVVAIGCVAPTSASRRGRIKLYSSMVVGRLGAYLCTGCLLGGSRVCACASCPRAGSKGPSGGERTVGPVFLCVGCCRLLGLATLAVLEGGLSRLGGDARGLVR